LGKLRKNLVKEPGHPIKNHQSWNGHPKWETKPSLTAFGKEVFRPKGAGRELRSLKIKWFPGSNPGKEELGPRIWEA